MSFNFTFFSLSIIINTRRYSSSQLHKATKFVDIILVSDLSLSELRECGYMD